MADLTPSRANFFRFGAFELDVRAGELRKHGIRMRLRQQPLQILLLLLERPGETVLREEIQLKLWPNNTIVEFDHGINAAIKKLRDALGETAGSPRHIETVARRGYRFLGHVEVVGEPTAEPPSAGTGVLDASDLEGQTISHYRVLEKLGSGGMGVVFRAKDLTLHRYVALKFLPEEYSRRVPILERFQREARAAAALNHPNICTIYEIGEHKSQPFIAMELLEGQTIKDRLAGTPFQVEELINAAIQIAEALEVAHAGGTVHRDIKPANLFVTQRGQVKVLDFGLAKLLPAQKSDSLHQLTAGDAATDMTAVADLTTPGALVGTVAYMSPEQARSEELDARTDLFIFGAVLYEMATGRRAFHGGSMPVILAAIIHESPVSPTLLNPELPAGLEKIVNRMLEKDRVLRYQTAGEIRADLQILKSRLQAGRTPGLPTEAAPVSGAEQVQAARAAGTLRQGSRRRLILFAVLLLITAAAGVGWLFVRQPNRRPLTQRRLTANPENLPVENAVISPDGRYLGYSDWRGIHLQLLATGETQSIPPPPEVEAGPARWEFEGWYPDSTHFTATLRIARKTSLWALSILAGAPRNLIDSEGYGGVVSPDGSHIAEFRSLSPREIWLMGPQGESPHIIMAVGDRSAFYTRIRWSPSGERIAYLKQVGSTEPLVESCDVNGSGKNTIFSGGHLGDFDWITPRRFIYSEMTPSTYGSPPGSLWDLRVDDRTGAPEGQPRQLAHWSGYAATSLSTTADGQHLAFVRETEHWSMFVADITTDGTHLDALHQMPDDDFANMAYSWSADSRSILFASDRGGTLGIYRQALNGAPQTVSSSPGLDAVRPQLSPDGSAVIFVGWPHGTTAGTTTLSGPAAIYRAPIGGGPVRRLLDLPQAWLKLSSFDLRCTDRTGGFCAYGLVSEDRRELTITSFDPDTGDHKELLRLPTGPVHLCDWALSPDGLQIAAAQLDPDAGQIQFISLRGGGARTIPIKGYSLLGSLNWDPASKGLFVGSGTTLLHVESNGSVQPIWQHPVRGDLWGQVRGVASPDGRHLALTGFNSAADVWLMDSFDAKN